MARGPGLGPFLSVSFAKITKNGEPRDGTLLLIPAVTIALPILWIDFIFRFHYSPAVQHLKVEQFLKLRVTFAGLLTAGGVVTAAATLGGFLGRFWWRFDLLAHFRVQYLVALTLISIGLPLLRRKRLAITFGVAALINLLVIAPLHFGRTSAEKGAPSLRAVMLNVNTANQQYEKVRTFLKEADADIVVIEEINAEWLRQLQPLTNVYPYVEAAPRENNFGIMLMSKHSFTTSCPIFLVGDDLVPSVFAECEIEGQPFAILGTHALPPRNKRYTEYRNEQLANIPVFLEQYKSPIILLGDLNATPWSFCFKKLLRETQLKDSAKGWGVQCTWPTFCLPVRIPIDHCLVSPELIITNRHTGPHIGSDHLPLIVDIVH